MADMVMEIRQRQDAGAEVERQMIDFMVQFTPCEKLELGHVKQIAAHARRLAFDLFEDREAHS